MTFMMVGVLAKTKFVPHELLTQKQPPSAVKGTTWRETLPDVSEVHW
jgi:hypothetical protein